MPAIKPVSANYDWAKLSTALKLNPSNKVLDYGWTTSNDLISGIPQKPILQYENGWKFGIYEWLNYLQDKTDETISVPVAGQSSNYFLKTNGSDVFTWSVINQVPIVGEVANYFLKASSPTAYGWQELRQVSPNGTLEYALKMTSASTYGWEAFWSSGSVQSTAAITFFSGTATLGSGNDRLISIKKVGNLVTFTCDLLVASTSSIINGEMRITGLPYTALYDTALNILINNVPTLDDFISPQARIKANTNYINLYSFLYGDSVSLSTPIFPTPASNFRISVSGSYITA